MGLTTFLLNENSTNERYLVFALYIADFPGWLEQLSMFTARLDVPIGSKYLVRWFLKLTDKIHDKSSKNVLPSSSVISTSLL